jgi:hypothetical protein
MRKILIRLALCPLLFALCVPAEAQQTGKVPRIGFLGNSTASGNAVLVETFRSSGQLHARARRVLAKSQKKWPVWLRNSTLRADT